MFDLHQFLTRSDRTLAAGGGARVILASLDRLPFLNFDINLILYQIKIILLVAVAAVNRADRRKLRD
jgi:hypothetical protein